MLQSFGLGLIFTTFAALVSWALARWGFGNLYYLAQLLPVFMVFYLLLAWLIYLKTGSPQALRQAPQVRADSLGHHENELSRDLPESKVSGAELGFTRDEHGLIQRKPAQPGTPAGAPRNHVSTLVWSACQLAALSLFLYYAFGIGARMMK